ncbi:hypothetical protein CLOSTHATH_05175 [Hungatella hathewayi DSM 13479]|uniref:Uncharacterized protein n=1 Tax=Hungatella hathewayi DSM 13479 TaxID=566550 RepID=D3ANH3_9FIRM|nr:hypothetical protein CLOSTHATH_05175 [Hungatella hathewayi DSM 13479]
MCDRQQCLTRFDVNHDAPDYKSGAFYSLILYQPVIHTAESRMIPLKDELTKPNFRRIQQ